MSDHTTRLRRAAHAWTLYLGLAIIIACTALVVCVDAPNRHWAVVPQAPVDDLPRPRTPLERVAREAAFNITGINWVGYLLVFDGLLTLVRRRPDAPIAKRRDEGSPLRERPNRFIVAWLTSIPVWCFFDWVNFYTMRAWDYHGLPASAVDRMVGYFVAFAAISPGMFLAAELYQRFGLPKLQVNKRGHDSHSPMAGVLSLGVILTLALIILLIGIVQQRSGMFLLSTVYLILPGLITLGLTRNLLACVLTFGITFTTWSIAIADPIGNLTLWVGLIYLLDPVNYALGGPSILRDWRAGRLGRTAALMAGGATCGFCWEFWNYWALSKWSYNLPFLGAYEQYRYFEMPWLGFMGFLPFAIECWVTLNTIILVLERLKLRLAEPLPDEDAII